MRRRVAHIDYQKLAENFRRGDVVQKLDVRTNSGSTQMIGQVTAVLRGIGYCDVEFAHGNERVPVEELVRINPEESDFLPPTVDTSYSSYDISKSRDEDGSSKQYSYARPRYATELMVEYSRKLASLWQLTNRLAAEGNSEVQTYHRIASLHGDRLSDYEIKEAVKHIYALYWHGSGRVYRRSKDELRTGRNSCPKCKTPMKKRAYKQGGRLNVCSSCGFMVKDEDLV